MFLSIQCCPLIDFNNNETNKPKKGWDFALSSDSAAPKKAEEQCTLLGIVGIEDPLRSSIIGAMDDCKRAGVDVRMCTGDALESAVAIAIQCGILGERDLEKNKVRLES